MRLVITALTLFAVSLMAVNASAQVPEMPEPTEHHKVLMEDVGTWDAEMKIWMGGPDTEPMVEKGSETNRMLGGFWLISNFKGSFGGMEFQGLGTFGYDPKTEKYVGSWMDSNSPNISHMEGTYDKSSKTMTMKMASTGMDGQPQEGKSVTVRTGKDTRLFTMYQKAGDDYVKQMEIKYTRRKKE